MANYQLTVEKRTKTGKSYARRLRTGGKVPAVVYGSGKPAINLEVEIREAERAMAAAGSLITLGLDGESKTVIVKDIHRDPVRGDLQHIDFHEIDLTKKLEISVPIRVFGEEQRVGDGGVVTTLLWEALVSCLPTDIPEAIEVDVSQMGIDDVINVADLDIPAGVEILEEPDEPVVRVGLPDLIVEEEEEVDEDLDELDEDAEEAEEDESVEEEPSEE